MNTLNTLRNYPLTILAAIAMVLLAVPLSHAYRQTDAWRYVCLTNRGAITPTYCK